MKPGICDNLVRRGFSLIETLAALTITAMIIIATINVYGRIRSVAASVERRVDDALLPNEIVQRIAQDIDRLTLPGLETTLAIANKFDGRYNLCRMEIVTRFYDGSEPPKPQIYEKVVWQSDYDPVVDAVILYRSHSGLNLEDKLVDKDLDALQQGGREMFIPVSTGITFFEIIVPQGDNEFREWRLNSLPRAVRVRVSFAQPREDFETGEWLVFDEDKVVRTIAIDRTRKLRYRFIRKEFELAEDDPNTVLEGSEGMGDEGAGEGEGTGIGEGEGPGEGPGPEGPGPGSEGPGPEGPGPASPRRPGRE
ncbi:MAG: prepilin-type N-terminal cleavage/methylation domain-containing protein [Phycisphaerae bacterium]|nr:prepilin-type N-terminal cleavage/methylation domain-containing protein [Phycisphaerae bacterium]